MRGQAAAEPDQVERLLVGLVRDPQAAAGVDDPDRGPAQPRELAGGASRRRGMGHERAGLEDVGRPEGMESEQLEVLRSGGQPGGIHEVGGVHPELARAVVTDEADPLEPRALGHGRPQQHGLAPTCGPSDALEPPELAERLDRHRPDPGLDGGSQLVVALARSGHDDPVGRDPGAQRGRQLAPGSDVRAEARGRRGTRRSPGKDWP